MSDPSAGPYAVNPFDDRKVRVAKLTLNLHRLTETRPKFYKTHARELGWRIAEEMDQAAADPLYADSLVDTRVTLAVRWAAPAAAVDDLLNTSVTHPDFAPGVARHSGDLVPLAAASLAAWGYPAEPPELCRDFYTMAAVTTASRAARLCALAHWQYADEIRTGRLRVGRRAHGPLFPDILTPAAAAAYVQTHARVSRCG